MMRQIPKVNVICSDAIKLCCNTSVKVTFDWKLLHSTGQEIFPDFAECLKQSMLWVVGHRDQTMSWKIFSRIAQDELKGMCRMQKKSGVGHV